MKTLTTIEAFFRLSEILNAFSVLHSTGIDRMCATVRNVSFADFFQLYSMLSREHEVRLELPGEGFAGEEMVLSFSPVTGLFIMVESEPCVKLIPKINILNLN